MVKEILKKLYSCAFHQDTINLFKLGWLFSFMKEAPNGQRPIVAGNSCRKLAGKVLSTEYKLPWKEAAGVRQYGLNTPDGIGMALLITEDTLATAEDLCARAVDERNSFNEAKRQKLLDEIYSRFPELSIFMETWYLDPTPLGFYLEDHTIAVIWSSQGVQQGGCHVIFPRRTNPHTNIGHN